MILVFNVYAILPLALGGLVGFLLSSSTSLIVSFSVGATVAAGTDLLQRFAHRDAPAALVNPRAGGHVFFIPVWAAMAIGLILCGLVKAGIFNEPPEPPRPNVVQNLRQLIEKEKAPAQAGKNVERKMPEQVVKKAPEIRPQRPSFSNAVVKKIALENGGIQVADQYAADDATDRGMQTPVKVYEVALGADKAYWLEAGPTSGPLNQHLRIEDTKGQILAEGRDDQAGQKSKLLFTTSASDNHRVIVSARLSQSGGFTLKIKEMSAGDSLPENERLVLSGSPKDSIQVALKTERFLSAAIAPDCKSAWVAFPMGKLQRFSCPDFAAADQYQFPKQAYQLAINGRGLLCAVVQRVNPARSVLAWRDLGPADIHLYDSRSMANEKNPLTPLHVISTGGIIEHLMISPDDSWLYFLDTHNRKVGRVNLVNGQLDNENGAIEPGTKAMCLTPDGKTLYTCAPSNLVQVLDPATLHIDKTIRLDKGTPIGIQATNDGTVFLNSGEGQWTHIYLINANRDYDGKIAKVMPWADVYHQHSILLSPDQTRLYGACFSLSPSNIKSYYVPRWPALYRAMECGGIGNSGGSARGAMCISRDGRFLFCDSGLILTLGR